MTKKDYIITQECLNRYWRDLQKQSRYQAEFFRLMTDLKYRYSLDNRKFNYEAFATAVYNLK